MKCFVLRDIPVVGAGTFVLAGHTAFTAKRAVEAVMTEITIPVHLNRLAIEPPVQEVEMVRGFVHEE